MWMAVVVTGVVVACYSATCHLLLMPFKKKNFPFYVPLIPPSFLICHFCVTTSLFCRWASISNCVFFCNICTFIYVEMLKKRKRWWSSSSSSSSWLVGPVVEIFLLFDFRLIILPHIHDMLSYVVCVLFARCFVFRLCIREMC